MTGNLSDGNNATKVHALAWNVRSLLVTRVFYQSPVTEIRIVFTDEGFAPFSYPYPDIGFRLYGRKPKFV